jgi:O-antigen/teichoic acid export membrane protein
MLVSTVFFLGVIRTWEDVFQLSHSDFSWAVLLLAVTVLLDNLNAHFLTLPQADHRFEIYNLRTLIVGTGNTFGTALVAYLTRSIPLILAFRIILYFITSLSLIKYAGKSLKTSHIWPKFNLHIAKKLTGFGLKNFIGKLANQLSYQFSNYAIGGMLSAGAVAAFSIPQNLIVKAAGAISQGTLAFFPLSTQLSSKEKIHKLRIFVITIEVLILIIGITEVLFIKFFGFTFLTLWLNDSELAIQAYPVLRILSWVFLLTTLTPIPTAVLNALNYPQVPSFFALLTSIGTISLIFLLTTQLGVIGPAYAALISSAITVPSFLITFVWIFIKFKPKE